MNKNKNNYIFKGSKIKYLGINLMKVQSRCEDGRVKTLHSPRLTSTKVTTICRTTIDGKRLEASRRDQKEP